MLLKRSFGIGLREQVDGFILETILNSSSSEIMSKLVRILCKGGVIRNGTLVYPEIARMLSLMLEIFSLKKEANSSHLVGEPWSTRSPVECGFKILLMVDNSVLGLFKLAEIMLEKKVCLASCTALLYLITRSLYISW